MTTHKRKVLRTKSLQETSREKVNEKENSYKFYTNSTTKWLCCVHYHDKSQI